MLTDRFDAVVTACFGTGDPALMDRVFLRLHRRLSGFFPGTPAYLSVTSRQVRQSLLEQGLSLPDPESLFLHLSGRGFRRVLVLGLFLFEGQEYARLRDLCRRLSGRFDCLLLTPPLLPARSWELARLLAARFPAREGSCLLLVGHGSAAASNRAYFLLEQALWHLGRRDCRMTLLAEPDALPPLAAGLACGGNLRLTLLFLTLSLGHHARIALESPDSLAARLQAAGFSLDLARPPFGSLPELPGLFFSLIPLAN